MFRIIVRPQSVSYYSLALPIKISYAWEICPNINGEADRLRGPTRLTPPTTVEVMSVLTRKLP